MANEWLRLWHDMPNDPKWRTIARISKQPISLVISLFTHLLVDASRNVTRGHINVTAEDLASALDVTEEQITAVLCAMEGRVKEGDVLIAWEKRQPRREDLGNPETGIKSAAQRKREQRDREKEASNNPQNTLSHDASRNVTLDKDKDKDYLKPINPPLSPPCGGDLADEEKIQEANGEDEAVFANEPPSDNPPPAEQKSRPEARESSRGTRMASDWELPDDWLQWSVDEGGLSSARHGLAVSEKFRDHWLAQPGLKGRKTDWSATWRNWVRREVEIQNEKNQRINATEQRKQKGDSWSDAVTGRNRSARSLDDIEGAAYRVD